VWPLIKLPKGFYHCKGWLIFSLLGLLAKIKYKGWATAGKEEITVGFLEELELVPC
jgi:hypothetical protein